VRDGSGALFSFQLPSYAIEKKKSGNVQPDPKWRGGTTKQSEGSRPKNDFADEF
jgi:hypothetical protein